MHTEFSIGKQVASLPDAQSKNYLWLMETHGLEMGIARGGRYSAHAHRNVADIIFAPNGMCSGEPGSPGYMSGSLLVALPGTWFGPVVAGDFFFVKFYCDQHRTGLPDKIIDRQLLDEGANGASSGLMIAQGLATVQLPMFRPGYPRTAEAIARISLVAEGLSCTFPGSDCLIVRE